MKLSYKEIEKMYVAIEILNKSTITIPIINQVDLALNKKALEVYVDAIKNSRKNVPKYDEYIKEMEDLAKEMSDKNTGGNPMTEMVDGVSVYKISDSKKEAFTSGAQALNVKYSEALKEQENKYKELEAFMKSQVEVNITTIDPNVLMGDCGDEKTKAMVEGLLPMLFTQ